MIQRSDETRARLSAALKAKWSSGTRKPNPRESVERAAASLRRAYAEGRVKKRDLEAMKAASSRGGRTVTAKKLAQIAKLAKAKLGVPNPPGPSGKGPENRFSKYWAFLAPNHTIMEGWNLNELVRANAHMFDPEDVVWKGKGSSNCRAVKGLSSLYGGRVNNCVSWKGWTAMTDAETRREYAMRKARGEG